MWISLLEMLAGPHHNKMHNHASRKRAEQNDFWQCLDVIRPISTYINYCIITVYASQYYLFLMGWNPLTLH